jgi:hypothetical protein
MGRLQWLEFQNRKGKLNWFAGLVSLAKNLKSLNKSTFALELCHSFWKLLSTLAIHI